MSLQPSKISRGETDFSWIAQLLEDKTEQEPISKILITLDLLNLPNDGLSTKEKIERFYQSFKSLKRTETTLLGQKYEWTATFLKNAEAQFHTEWDRVLNPLRNAPDAIKEAAFKLESSDDDLIAVLQKHALFDSDSLLLAATRESLPTATAKILQTLLPEKPNPAIKQLSETAIKKAIDQSIANMTSKEEKGPNAEKIFNSLLNACFTEGFRIKEENLLEWIKKGLESETPTKVYSLLLPFLDDDYQKHFFGTIVTRLSQNKKISDSLREEEIVKSITDKITLTELYETLQTITPLTDPILFEQLFTTLKRQNPSQTFYPSQEILWMIDALKIQRPFALNLWESISQEIRDLVFVTLAKTNSMNLLTPVLNEKNNPTPPRIDAFNDAITQNPSRAIEIVKAYGQNNLVRSIVLALETKDTKTTEILGKYTAFSADFILLVATKEGRPTVVSQLIDLKVACCAGTPTPNGLFNILDLSINQLVSTDDPQKQYSYKAIAILALKALQKLNSPVVGLNLSRWIDQGLNSKTPTVVYSLLLPFFDEKTRDHFIRIILQRLSRTPHMNFDVASSLMPHTSDQTLIHWVQTLCPIKDSTAWLCVCAELDQRKNGDPEQKISELKDAIKYMSLYQSKAMIFFWTHCSQRTYDKELKRCAEDEYFPDFNDLLQQRVPSLQTINEILILGEEQIPLPPELREKLITLKERLSAQAPIG